MRIFSNKFHFIMWGTAIGSGLLLLLFAVLYCFFGMSVFLSLAITSGTIFYHFVMRLVVGGVFHSIPLHRFQPEAWWFRSKKFEEKLYQCLKLKKWKVSMPTYNPEDFSLQLHTPVEIAQRTCESELVHTANTLLSFVPMLAVPIWGVFWVFLLTSAAAAAYDLVFVLMQRYNRPRLLRYASRRAPLNHT